MYRVAIFADSDNSAQIAAITFRVDFAQSPKSKNTLVHSITNIVLQKCKDYFASKQSRSLRVATLRRKKGRGRKGSLEHNRLVSRDFVTGAKLWNSHPLSLKYSFLVVVISRNP